MKLDDAIERIPRPFDPQRGREAAATVANLSGSVHSLCTGAAGCSPYLAGLIEREAEWLSGAVGNFEKAVQDQIAWAEDHPPEGLADGLRQAKRRMALMIALADLGGAWPLDKVTGTLTAFADACCRSALRAAILQQIRRGKLPGMTEEDASNGAGMVVLAMGKMGAGELNYSSDIDLICLFDETRFEASDYHEARAAFARATRFMAATLSEITASGYVFRTDLRLRPDPSVTPVCIAMEAAEQYYESLGRTWERAAYIKARPAAGDIAAGARFLDRPRPFVWRRHLDFAAIQDAHDMRLAIREHKGLGGPIVLTGQDMKLGRGGIREIEFFTQTRQLIAGGRDPDLRCRGTVPGLRVLARKGWVDEDVSVRLQAHYVAHRTVEHRLQMVQDAQTHSLPRTPEGFARLASMMDREEQDLRDELRERLADVHGLTEGFFAPGKPEGPEPEAAFDPDVLDRWITYPALRSARGQQIFERVKPDLLARLAAAARPQDALLAFDGFLSGLPAGVQLFSLLEANPQLADLIIDVTGTSPALAQYLSRNAEVFDAVIGGDFFSDWPGQSGLEALLRPVLERETDYERKLDATRRWYKEWHFRVGVHLLRGLSTTREANAQYSDLARAVLAVLLPEVTEEFAVRHGAPPGRGAVVLGMGSLGAGTLSPGSDLDLIVIYDPGDAEVSNGKKPLFIKPYYAKLTQSLITALTAPMAQGRLFDVDMRLRPSGNQGPVATSWAAFQSYQSEEAWIWEHLALTRASVVAGPADLAADVERFLDGLLGAPRPVETVAREVAQMRSRIQEAKSADGLWEVKVGPGRLQEIELLAQAGALLSGNRTADARAGLAAAAGAGLLSTAAADRLADAAEMMSSVHTAVRLLTDLPSDGKGFGSAAEAFLTRATGVPSLDTLAATLAEAYAEADRLLSAALQPYTDPETSHEG